MPEKGFTAEIALAFNPKSMKWLDTTAWLESCRKDKYLNPASDEKPETESRSETPNPPSSHIRAHPMECWEEENSYPPATSHQR